MPLTLDQLHWLSPLPLLILHLPRHTQHPPLHQLAMLETELAEQVHELQKRKHVRGTPLMLEEMLNLIEEEVVDWTLDFLGGDDEIVEYVTQEVRDNNNDDDESEDDEVEDTEKQITNLGNALDLCACMEHCVSSILRPIFLSQAPKLNCTNFKGISVDLTTSPKSKFPWTTSGLLPGC
jgi:hypothetical protein